MPSVLLDHGVIAYGVIGAILMATSDLSDAHLIVLGLLKGKNGLARVSPPWYDTVLRVVAPWLLGMAFFTAQLSEADADGGTIAMFAVSLVVLVAGHVAYEVAAGMHETARGASTPVRYREIYGGAVLLYMLHGVLLGLSIDRLTDEECGHFRTLSFVSAITLSMGEILLAVSRYRTHQAFRITAWLIGATQAVCWTLLAVSFASRCV